MGGRGGRALLFRNMDRNAGNRGQIRSSQNDSPQGEWLHAG